MPKYWDFQGRNADEFTTTIYSLETPKEKYLSLECQNPKRTYAAGSVLQTFDACNLQGQVIELSGLLSSENVVDKAGLFLRVNGPNRMLEKMDRNPVRGTTDWKAYRVPLSVPADARSISIGFYLEGEGRLDVKQVAFSIVDPEACTPPEYIPQPRKALTPVNLALN